MPIILLAWNAVWNGILGPGWFDRLQRLFRLASEEVDEPTC